MEPWQLLTAGFVPAFVRALGMVVLLPIERDLAGWLGGFSFAALLGVFFAPQVAAGAAFSWGALPFEFITGGILALPLALSIAAAVMFGELIDVARGQSLSELYDPLNGSSSSTLAILFRQYLWISLLLSGMLEVLLTAFSKSFNALPDAGLLVSKLTEIAPLMLSRIGQTLTELLILLVPLVLAFFFIEMLMGFFSKALPRVSLQTESFLIKSGMAYLFLHFLQQFDGISRFFETSRPLLGLISG